MNGPPAPRLIGPPAVRTLLVLGIDPGTQRTGYGLVALDRGALRHVDSGVIAPPRQAALPDRLVAIYDGLAEVIERHGPGAIAVEDVFYAKHAQGALKLGHARGVCLLAAARLGLEVHSYAPAMVKRAISGHGRAEKDQIARLVKMILCLETEPPADAADALAVAICHAAGASRLP